MKELKRISPHQPEEIVVVNDDKVSVLLATGLYKEINPSKTKSDKVESNHKKKVEDNNGS